MVSVEVVNITDHDLVFSDDFADAVGTDFQEIVFEFDSTIDVEKLVDRVEDVEEDDWDVQYPADVSWCKVSIPDIAFEVIVEDRCLRLSSSRRLAPKSLLENLYKAQKALAAGGKTPLLLLS